MILSKEHLRKKWWHKLIIIAKWIVSLLAGFIYYAGFSHIFENPFHPIALIIMLIALAISVAVYFGLTIIYKIIIRVIFKI